MTSLVNELIEATERINRIIQERKSENWSKKDFINVKSDIKELREKFQSIVKLIKDLENFHKPENLERIAQWAQQEQTVGMLDQRVIFLKNNIEDNETGFKIFLGDDFRIPSLPHFLKWVA